MSADTVIPQAGVALIYETVDKAILEGLKRFAHTALERGFHPLPCRRKEKTPCITRSANGDRLPTHGEIDGWDCDAVALVCNHILVFDFDQAGAFWPKWSAKVQAERSDLWARLPIERSQNGGMHVVARTKRPFLSQKLAHLVVEVSGPGEHPGRGPSDKKYRAREYRGKWVIAPDAIETRGHTTGLPSYCLTHPTPGYELIQGEILDMPVLADADVEYLISVSREFEEYFPESPIKKDPPAHTGSGSPGDDYNERGDVRALLEAHDWQPCGSRGEYEHFTRPGKASGISGALIEGHLFHCFSSNGFPFEDGKTYSKFAVFALLEHDGDYSAAARALAVQGYGVPVRERIEAAGQGSAENDKFLAGIFNGADLLKMDLPEIKWAVPGLLPAGLVILAGGPKLGKSWLIYGVVAGVGAGGLVLGHFQSNPGKVLYLALEDSKKRLQDRLRSLCQIDPGIEAGLARVDFQVTWPRFDDEGGLDKLETYIVQNVPVGLKLVVIDTMAKVGPKAKAKGLNAYESDSLAMGRIKALADKHGICILLITHLNKLRTSKDPFEAITGSMGQFGTADTAMLLARTRGADTAKLMTTGRDIEGHTYGLRWLSPGWTCTGIDNSEPAPKMTQERQAVLQVFQENTGPMSPAMVANATGKTPRTTSYHIKKLEEEGFLFSVGYGLYSLAGSAGSTGSVRSAGSTGSGHTGDVLPAGSTSNTSSTSSGVFKGSENAPSPGTFNPTGTDANVVEVTV